MLSMNEAAGATVAVCRCGGAVVMALTEGVGEVMREELEDAEADGCRVSQMTVAEARGLPYGCKCLRRGVQLVLAV